MAKLVKICMMLLMIALIAQFSLAATVERIKVEDCGFQTTTGLSCGDTVTVSCDVNDTMDGVGAVNDVIFTVGSASYSASLVSGTDLDGTWEYDLDITSSNAADVYLSAVSVVDSGGYTCSGSDTIAPGEDCYLTFANRTATADCDCTWSTAAVCGVDNTAVVTHTPSDGCIGESVYTTSASCDYCDGGFVFEYSSCSASEFASGWFSSLLGTATKTYTQTVDGQSCCAVTGLASDCVAPDDKNTAVQCSLDYWLGAGRTRMGTYDNELGSQVGSDTEEFSRPFASGSVVTTAVVPSTRQLESLVFDVDRDGSSELVVFEDAGFRQYNVRLDDTEEVVAISGASYWQGQPGSFGFDDAFNYSGGRQYNVDNALVSNSSLGLGIAGIVRMTDTHDHFVTYRYEGGSWVSKVDLDLFVENSGDSAVGSGVSCSFDDCYFISSSQNVWRVDPLAGTYTVVDPFGNTANYTDNFDSSPVFLQFGTSNTPEVVAIEGIDDPGNSAIVVCTMSLGTCNTLQVGPSFGPGDVTRLVAGAPSPTYTSVLYGIYDSVGEYYSLGFVQVDSDATIITSGTTDLSGQLGGVPQCLGDVALGNCAGGSGQDELVTAVKYEANLSSLVDTPELVGTTTMSTASTTNGQFDIFGNYVGVARPLGTSCTFDIFNRNSGTLVSSKVVNSGFSSCYFPSLDVVGNYAAFCGVIDTAGSGVDNFFRLYDVSTPALTALVGSTNSHTGPIELTECRIVSTAGDFVTVVANEMLGGQATVITVNKTSPYAVVLTPSSSYAIPTKEIEEFDSDNDVWTGSNTFYDISDEGAIVSLGVSGYGSLVDWNDDSDDPKYVTSDGHVVFPTSTYDAITATSSKLTFTPRFIFGDGYVVGIGNGVWQVGDFTDINNPVSVNTSTTITNYGYNDNDASSVVRNIKIGDYIYFYNYSSNDLTTYYVSSSLRNAVVSVDNSYVEFGCFEQFPSSPYFRELSSFVVSSELCPTTISSVDVTGDGVSEVVTSEGVYSFTRSGRLLNFSGGSNVTAVQAVDSTMDTYVDFLLVTSSSLRNIVSVPSRSVSIAESLDVSGVQCSYDDSTNKITISPYGVTAVNPDWVTYSAKVYKDGSVVDTLYEDGEPLYYIPKVTGDLDIALTITDELLDECATGLVCTGNEGEARTCYCLDPGSPSSQTVLCNVSVSGDIASHFTPPEVTGCSIDPDGEFNFVDLDDSNWLLGSSTRNVPTLTGSVGRFFQETDMIHGVSCSDVGLSVEIRMKPSSDSETTFLVEGISDSGNGARSVVIGGVAVNDGVLYLYDAVTGELLRVADVNVGEFINVEMEFDADDQVYYVGVDGTSQLASSGFLTALTGEYSSLRIHHYDDSVDIDYIRTSATTGVVRDTRSDEEIRNDYAFQSLQSCTFERNFSANPPGKYKVYSNVDEYCNRVNKDGGFCSFSQLADAVRYNGECYQEANNYCLDITYPKTGGFEDGKLKYNPAKMDGVMACSTALSSSVAIERTALPIWRATWVMMLAHPIFFIVGIFMLVFSIVLYGRRN